MLTFEIVKSPVYRDPALMLAALIFVARTLAKKLFDIVRFVQFPLPMLTLVNDPAVAMTYSSQLLPSTVSEPAVGMYKLPDPAVLMRTPAVSKLPVVTYE
jgi:hypothetical protein